MCRTKVAYSKSTKSNRFYKEFTDVTLATNDDKQVDAHRIILSSQSLFFNRILQKNGKSNLLIYLPNINHAELESVLKYIYLGETEVEEQNLEKFIAIGKEFKIRGFEGENIGSDMLTNKEYEGDFLKIDKQKLERQENGKFACNRCEFQSVRRSDVKRHRDSVHLCVKYKCNECTMEYTSKAQVNAHVDSAHRGQVNQCEQCNKIFSHPNSLRFHVRQSHEGLETICKECNKDFQTYGRLNYHIRKEHKGLRYSCDQCEHQAATISNLKTHKEGKHKQDVFYSCDQCDYKTKWAASLRGHIEKIHLIITKCENNTDE